MSIDVLLTKAQLAVLNTVGGILTLGADLAVVDVVTPIYQNGKFFWGGDWSWTAGKIAVNYAATPPAAPPSGASTVIGVKTSAAYCGFMPYATNQAQDLSPFQFLNFTIFPTQNEPFKSGWDTKGPPPVASNAVETPLGSVIQDTWPAGVWTTVKVPLGTGGYDITLPAYGLKVMWQPIGGAASDEFFLDNIYLSAA